MCLSSVKKVNDFLLHMPHFLRGLIDCLLAGNFIFYFKFFSNQSAKSKNSGIIVPGL
jgi:hypothetical protein